MSEAAFDLIYGSPLLQAAVGLKASNGSVRPKLSEGASHLALVSRRIDELKKAVRQGGPREAMVRALLYIRMPEGVADERGFNFLRRLRKETGDGLSLADFKKLLRDQFLMLTLDERGAVEALPGMLAKDRELASDLADKLRKLLSVVGVQREESKRRLTEIEGLLEGVRKPSEPAVEKARPAPTGPPAHAHGSRSSKHH